MGVLSQRNWRLNTVLALSTLSALSNLIARRSISPVEVVTAVLERISSYDGTLRTHITVCGDRAVDAAHQAEHELMQGHLRGPLHGIPVSVKDNAMTKGVLTTCHSRLLASFVPDYDATYVKRLTDGGMILIGKTNMNEFAWGTMDLFGEAKNPWSFSLYPGGSSGGSAAAVGAGLAVAATGTDTAGSIRIPAAFCGVVGLKPSYGRISRYGVFPLSWSMDHVGPLARTVSDCALLLTQMAGFDPLDPTTNGLPTGDLSTAWRGDLGGVVLGVPVQYFFDTLDPDIDLTMRAAFEDLEGLGARLEFVDLPLSSETAGVSRIVMAAEAFAAHAGWLRQRPEEYGVRARRRIAEGAFFSAADYLQALQIRRLWLDQLSVAMERVDALVTPTTPFPAFSLEDHRQKGPSTSMLTAPFNLSGMPAISLPCGFTKLGLPVGMQLVGRMFDEAKLLQIAHAYEQSTQWHVRVPSIDHA